MGFVRGLRQIGHAPALSESAAGIGTVKMGRYDVDDMGGCRRDGEVLMAGFKFGDGDVVFVVAFFFSEGSVIPVTTGAGRSRASVTLRASCREKSLACHHSRNFKANMDAGRKNRNDCRSCGYTFCGLSRPNRPDPGRWRALLPPGLGCMAIAMAR